MRKQPKALTLPSDNAERLSRIRQLLHSPITPLRDSVGLPVCQLVAESASAVVCSGRAGSSKQ